MTFYELVTQYQQLLQYLTTNLTQLDDQSLALFYGESRRFSYISESIRGEMQRRIGINGSVCGWHLVRQAGPRTIGNPDLAYECLKGVLTKPDFLSCCTTSIPKLQGLYMQRRHEMDPSMSESICVSEFLQVIQPHVTRKPDVLVLRR